MCGNHLKTSMMNKYVHGYSDYEANRLHDQADSLADLLHYDSVNLPMPIC